MKRHTFSSKAFWTLSALFASFSTVLGVARMDFATVTRVENKVTVAEIKDGKATGARPAAVSDIIRANHFVQTASTSRAELEFGDKSIIRVGPNAVFSFDARSRTISLQKGDMLFYLPPNRGGATIKTPALTAAITGTVVSASAENSAIEVLGGGSASLFHPNGDPVVDSNGEQVTITAGTENNGAKAENGGVGTYKADGGNSSTDAGALAGMAPLPDAAANQIAESSPWCGNGSSGNESAGGTPAEGSFENSGLGAAFVGGASSGATQLFGGGGGPEDQTTTPVLPDGSVGF